MIDAHQHFWRLDRGDYFWIDDSVAKIRRDFLPENLSGEMREAGVSHTILVQATETVAETEFMLSLAADHPTIAGVVGWVDFASPDAVQEIDRLRQDPKLKGLRPMLQSIDDTDWILRPDVQPALRHLRDSGLRFDALIQPRHLGAIVRLAQAYPDLPIVIDHIAKPKMGGRQTPAEDWAQGMEILATLPNVWCKFSGMVTEVGPDWHIDDLRPFSEVVLAAFGPQKLMWGSDWPVLNLAGDYQRWADTARALTDHLTKAEQARIFSGSAREFYGIERYAPPLTS